MTMRFSIGTGSAEVESEFAAGRESARTWGLGAGEIRLLLVKERMSQEDQEPDEQGDPELQSLVTEIQALEAEERQVSALRQQIHDRLASFPNDVTARQERELSGRRVELHAEIDRLQSELVQRRAERGAAE